MEELNKKKLLFREENKVLRRAKKGEYTHEEITSHYEELLDQFKLVSKVSSHLNKKSSDIISKNNTEIEELKKENKKLNKNKTFLSICLALTGIVVILLTIF